MGGQAAYINTASDKLPAAQTYTNHARSRPLERNTSLTRHCDTTPTMSGGPQDLSELEQDPRLFLYTSLTAGSSHIVTATSRIETILRANRIPFMHIDTATNEKAKRLWVRRAGKRKLPALVKDGFVIGVCELSVRYNIG